METTTRKGKKHLNPKRITMGAMLRGASALKDAVQDVNAYRCRRDVGERVTAATIAATPSRSGSPMNDVAA
jgi:hypothetical protein